MSIQMSRRGRNFEERAWQKSSLIEYSGNYLFCPAYSSSFRLQRRSYYYMMLLQINKNDTKSAEFRAEHDLAEVWVNGSGYE